MLRWAIIWIIGAIALTGIFQYVISGWDLALWQYNIRMVAGGFFLIAFIVGGVLTTDQAYRQKKRSYYREDWSLICILVTIALFGISYFLS
ncbi:hypothetical protein [Thermoflavimicrobium dichotomicum]|uniref:Uncharacterized protein n=1 Tax=Thermoflavimicrobium dichotomicum TaxID=46223 RepID=A0A1I3RH43_9BACL|nr:hypothetical protein [Thermoflavimicrobium dichotomicum]SFJ45588.1 hypothetical protein SAMN05421852_11020 [Thermoflavimicrobium dichotomicum]